jgi:hypothetical protein
MTMTPENLRDGPAQQPIGWEMRVGRRTLDRAGSDSAIVPTIARVVPLCTVNENLIPEG